MRDAESLLDQCIAASDRSVSLELARRVLGLVDAQLTIELLKGIAGRDRKGVLAIVDRVVDSGLDLDEFFLAYIEGLRNLLVLSVQGDASTEFLDLSASEIEEYGAIARTLSTENLLYLFRSAARCHRDLKSSGQPRYELEAAFTEAASWESAVELSDLIRRLDGTGGGPARREEPPVADPAQRAKRREPPGFESAARPAARPTAEVPPAKPLGAAIVDPSRGIPQASNGEGTAAAKGGAEGSARASGAFATLERSATTPVRDGDNEDALAALGGKEQWERFLAKIREAKLTLGIWLGSASVKKVAGNRIALSFSPQNRFAREMTLEEKNRRFVEFHLERFFGTRFLIEAGEEADRTAERSDGENPPAPKRGTVDPGLAAIAGGSPAIEKLIEEFDGELFGEQGDGEEAPGK